MHRNFEYRIVPETSAYITTSHSKTEARIAIRNFYTNSWRYWITNFPVLSKNRRWFCSICNTVGEHGECETVTYISPMSMKRWGEHHSFAKICLFAYIETWRYATRVSARWICNSYLHGTCHHLKYPQNTRVKNIPRFSFVSFPSQNEKK